ncbi:MAG TPA: hypothetical protein VHR72_09730 [Gemmataceae bacterium]|nr:hypothetical protein [Gemmataceae bacterium]
MTKFEVFSNASSELGQASAEELSRHIEVRYGVLIPVPHIAIFRATLQHRKERPLIKNGERRTIRE